MSVKLCYFHLHGLVPRAVLSQIPEATHEALAGVAVDSAGLQHGLALFHKLGDTMMQRRGQIHPEYSGETRQGTNGPSYSVGIIKHHCLHSAWTH